MQKYSVIVNTNTLLNHSKDAMQCSDNDGMMIKYFESYHITFCIHLMSPQLPSRTYVSLQPIYSYNLNLIS